MMATVRYAEKKYITTRRDWNKIVELRGMSKDFHGRVLQNSMRNYTMTCKIRDILKIGHHRFHLKSFHRRQMQDMTVCFPLLRRLRH